jgi:hypothetical protein
MRNEGYRSLLGLPISYGDASARCSSSPGENADHPTDELLVVARRLADEAAIASSAPGACSSSGSAGRRGGDGAPPQTPRAEPPATP